MCSEDHPRLCGEKFPVTLKNIISTGSPPPMRGKAYKTLCDMEAMRITPAYAGKSVSDERKWCCV